MDDVELEPVPALVNGRTNFQFDPAPLAGAQGLRQLRAAIILHHHAAIVIEPMVPDPDAANGRLRPCRARLIDDLQPHVQ